MRSAPGQHDLHFFAHNWLKVTELLSPSPEVLPPAPLTPGGVQTTCRPSLAGFRQPAADFGRKSVTSATGV